MPNLILVKISMGEFIKTISAIETYKLWFVFTFEICHFATKD